MNPSRAKVIVRTDRTPPLMFGGLDHVLVPKPGYVYDMQNMTVENFPVLSTRPGRTLYKTLAKPNGFGSRGDILFWVDGTNFVYNNEVKGQVQDSKKTFAKIGPYICIFPDKVYFNTKSGELKAMGISLNASITFTKYTYDAEGEEAQNVYQGNAIRSTTKLPFDPGEAVVISGARNAGNNRSAIIREILDDGKLLVFDNNVWIEDAQQTVTVERKIPDMQFFVEFGNRLWGCQGDTIYASALGIPWRWYNLGTASTDSWYTEAGSEGDFTGAAKLGGYPIFFKENHVHKVYGSKPTNFSCLENAVTGLLRGCDQAIANAGEQLFYVSHNGVVAYAGGIPYDISDELGIDILEATAGSDGRRYYLSARTKTGWTLYCFDSKYKMWTKEDGVHAVQFTYSNGLLYYLDADGHIYTLNSAETETSMPWYIETGDVVNENLSKEIDRSVQPRIDVRSGSAQMYIQYDSSGTWERLGQMIPAGTEQYKILPVKPRKCDHYRLKIIGNGAADIYGVARVDV